MLVCFCVELFRNTISVDSMEAITWGELISFGTNKHPPLSGWLADGFYRLFFQHEVAIYLLGVLCIAVGLIYIYKLANYFLEPKKALCSTLIIALSEYYTYLVFYYNFNCNVLAMALWPALTYYFYKSIKFDKLKYWILFGVVAALCFLAKYQIIFVFFGMFLYLLLCEGKYFKKKGLYIAFIIGLLLITPHIIWLFQNDFFPFGYYTDKVQLDSGVEKSVDYFAGILYTFRFYVEQLLALAPCFVVYLFLILKEKSVEFKNIKENKKDSLFILSVGLVPLIVTGLSGIITSNQTTGAWGSSMIGFAGIILFYFFPIKFEDKTYKYFLKWFCSLAICWQLALLVFVLVQTKTDMAILRQNVISDFNKIWMENTGNKNIKYVSGCNEYVFHFSLDKNSKHMVVLDTFGHKNPWVNYSDIEKNGALIVAQNEDSALNYATEVAKFLPQKYNFEVKKYSSEVTSKIKKSQQYEIFYIIIPPIKTLE